MITRSIDQLVEENERLRRELDEMEATVLAIRAGEVDAVVVGVENTQVFTLESADKSYRLLVEQLPTGAAVLTLDGMVLHCNVRFADLMQRPLELLRGHALAQYVSPASRALFKVLLLEARTGSSKGEIVLARADGSLTTASLGVRAFHEGVVGECLIVTDLTEEEARKKLARTADRMAQLQKVTAALSEALTVNQVAEVIITHGLAAMGASVGVVAILSDDGAELVNVGVMGYPAEVVKEWTSCPVSAQLPMADAVRSKQAILVTTVAEQAARYPDLARLKAIEGDGMLAAFPLLVHGRVLGAMRLHFRDSRPLHQEDLEHIQTLAQQCGQALERASLHDSERLAREKAEQEIEERKRAENTLRENEARFRDLVYAMPAAVFTTDREGRITLFNEQAAELWGQRPEIGKDRWCGSWRIFRPDGTLLPHDQCPLAVALREGRAIRGQEMIIERQDGSRACVLPHPEPLRDASGEIVGAVNMLVDITERKLVEEALKDADRRKNEFLAMLAHELRNPLAPIMHALHMMQMPDAQDYDAQWARDVIKRQTHQLNRLVDDLLDVSRITRGKVELRLENIELRSVIERAVETSQPAIDAGRHQLTIALPQEPIWLHADPIRLGQVFGNLLNNAAKYMEPGGQIWLTAERLEDRVAVRVRDAGIGMPPEMLPKIFDLFAQADRSLDRSQGGLGIGLSLVQSLVQMHGGTVRAFSEGPGKGSEFVVSLPVLSGGSKEAPDRPMAQSSALRPPLRVLVVDDNLDAAKLLAMVLCSDGHDATVASDGQSAIAGAQAHKPDVILLDIGLPGMDGYEVCRRLRQLPGLEQTMLVALTGYAQDEDRRNSQAAGFDAHLVKPMSMTQLQDLFARAASLRQVAPGG